MGACSPKTVIDKKTFSNLELFISVIIGFIVFEIISKWLKKKIEQAYPACKTRVLGWMGGLKWVIESKDCFPNKLLNKLAISINLLFLYSEVHRIDEKTIVCLVCSMKSCCLIRVKK